MKTPTFSRLCYLVTVIFQILDYKTLRRIERSQRKAHTRDETFHGLREENSTDGNETQTERAGTAAGKVDYTRAWASVRAFHWLVLHS